MHTHAVIGRPEWTQVFQEALKNIDESQNFTSVKVFSVKRPSMT